MFGFEDKRPAAVEEARLYIRSMFAGLGDADGTVPHEIFADPYVAGFLQVLSTHAVAVAYKSGMPGQADVVSIMAEALNRLQEGAGSTALLSVMAFADPLNRRHDDYRRGRHDGSEHVRRLLSSYENMGDERHEAFQAYVVSHFLR